MLLDGCHMEVIFILNGCHVPNDSHLAIWGLDTAPMDDLRCDAVEWCSLGGDVGRQQPRQACRGNLGTCLRGGLDLTRLASQVREVSFSNILFSWLVLGLLVF